MYFAFLSICLVIRITSRRRCIYVIVVEDPEYVDWIRLVRLRFQNHFVDRVTNRCVSCETQNFLTSCGTQLSAVLSLLYFLLNDKTLWVHTEKEPILHEIRLLREVIICNKYR